MLKWLRNEGVRSIFGLLVVTLVLLAISYNVYYSTRLPQ